MEPLTPFAKGLILVIGAGTVWAAVHTYGGAAESDAGKRALATPEAVRNEHNKAGAARSGVPAAAGTQLEPASVSVANIDARPVRVALSQWPGHMALVV